MTNSSLNPEAARKLIRFVEDLAENGTRFDLNPTIDASNWVSVAEKYVQYIHHIDKSVRDRAMEALARVHEEPR